MFGYIIYLLPSPPPKMEFRKLIHICNYILHYTELNMCFVEYVLLSKVLKFLRPF